MKNVFAKAAIENLFIHWVGNQCAGEGIQFSETSIPVHDEVRELLIHYFIHPFRTGEYMNLQMQTAPGTANPIFEATRTIFQNPQVLGEVSKNLARYLYEQTTRPQIKHGEFYTVYFRNCVLDGEPVDAIGLFKSENKNTFLQIYPSEKGFGIKSQTGIDVDKLDKGCIIFNREQEQGFLTAVTDNTNKRNEAKYWMDSFLHARNRTDSFTQTQQLLAACKEFVQTQWPEAEGVDKMKKAMLVNRGMEALRENATVRMDDFAREVFGQPNLAEQFRSFVETYGQKQEVHFNETFQTAPQAVKRKGMGTMTTIRLDKNFAIQIFGGEQFIEKTYDEQREMFCYKLYFKEEK